MTVTLSFKDLLKTAARSVYAVAFLFAAAWIAGPLPSPTPGVGGTIIDALVQVAKAAPFLVIAAVLIGPRWPDSAAVFGRVPLIRLGAAAAWILAAVAVHSASDFAHASLIAPMIVELVFGFSIGCIGTAILCIEIQNARESAG